MNDKQIAQAIKNYAGEKIIKTEWKYVCKCPQCETRISSAANYCSRCGMKLLKGGE